MKTRQWTMKILGWTLALLLASCAPAQLEVTPASTTNPTTARPAKTAAPETTSTPIAPAATLPPATSQVIVGTAVPAVTAATLPTPQPVVTGTLTTGGGDLVVTLEDRGKTVSMRPGERFLLQLGEGYVWEVTVGDQAVLSRVVNVTVIRGAQGLYEARQAGATQLAASGEPACRSANPPCSMPSIYFTINVVVK